MRHSPDNEFRTYGGALLKTGDASDAPALPPPYALPDARPAEPTALDTAKPPPVDFAELNRQAQPFKTSSRRLARNRIVGTGGSREAQAAYGRIRTQLIHRLQENGWNTVAVGSPTRGAGSTLTAINLAVSIAQDFSYTVVLVELDFANPSFRKMLGFRQKQGVVDYLLHDAPLGDIILTPGLPRLVIVPAGSPTAHSSALLSSLKMARFCDEIKAQYEHCIMLFDLPCVLSSDHAAAFAPFVDCALLVVEEGETRVNEVRCSLDCLRATNVLGVVLNRFVHLNRDGKAIFA